MRRKLQHTAMALTVSAAVFAIILLAGGRYPPGQVSNPARLALDASRAAAPLGLGAVDVDVVAAGELLRASSGSDSEIRHQRHSRALLALPYFSFAQGLRHNRS